MLELLMVMGCVVTFGLNSNPRFHIDGIGEFYAATESPIATTNCNMVNTVLVPVVNTVPPSIYFIYTTKIS